VSVHEHGLIVYTLFLTEQFILTYTIVTTKHPWLKHWLAIVWEY